MSSRNQDQEGDQNFYTLKSLFCLPFSFANRKRPNKVKSDFWSNNLELKETTMVIKLKKLKSQIKKYQKAEILNTELADTQAFTKMVKQYKNYIEYCNDYLDAKANNENHDHTVTAHEHRETSTTKWKRLTSGSDVTPEMAHTSSAIEEPTQCKLTIYLDQQRPFILKINRIDVELRVNQLRTKFERECTKKMLASDDYYNHLRVYNNRELVKFINSIDSTCEDAKIYEIFCTDLLEIYSQFLKVTKKYVTIIDEARSIVEEASEFDRHNSSNKIYSFINNTKGGTGRHSVSTNSHNQNSHNSHNNSHDNHNLKNHMLKAGKIYEKLSIVPKPLFENDTELAALFDYVKSIIAKENAKKLEQRKKIESILSDGEIREIVELVRNGTDGVDKSTTLESFQKYTVKIEEILKTVDAEFIPKEIREFEDIKIAAHINNIASSIESAIKYDQLADIETLEEALLQAQKLFCHESSKSQISQNYNLCIKNLEKLLIESLNKEISQNTKESPWCLESLQKAVVDAKRKRSQFDLNSVTLTLLLDKCQRLEFYLKEVNRLKDLILSSNREKVAELISYTNPSEMIVKVLKSVLYLLGEKRANCSDWQKIKILIAKSGKESIQRRIAEFKNAQHIGKKFRTNILQELKEYDYEQVEDQSKVLAVFYKWTRCHLEFNL